MKKISVCMATYNGSKYIRQQLESILNQLSEDDEIIISDDGSTDDTFRIIEDICDKRIKVYNNTKHGCKFNFENAINHASGEIIFLSDQDDIWEQNKVEIVRTALETCDFVVSDACIIDGDGNFTGESFYELRRPYRGYWGNLIKFGYLGCTMAFNKRVLKKILPFPPYKKYCTHDNWIFCAATTFFPFKVLDEKLIRYRRHGNNVSTLKTETTIFRKVLYRSLLLLNLVKKIFK